MDTPRILQIKSPVGHSDWHDLARGLLLAVVLGGLGYIGQYLATYHTDNTALASALGLAVVVINDVISKIKPASQP